MQANEKNIRLIIYFILLMIGIIGFVLIGKSSSWWTALGVYFLLWANNSTCLRKTI